MKISTHIDIFLKAKVRRRAKARQNRALGPTLRNILVLQRLRSSERIILVEPMIRSA